MSLALGIGANTAIYSFMESILLRSLPVADPESLVVLNWHSRPPEDANKEWVHVVHGLQGIFWPGDKGALVSGIFPYPAFETLREENPVFFVDGARAARGYGDGNYYWIEMMGRLRPGVSIGARRRQCWLRVSTNGLPPPRRPMVSAPNCPR